MAIVTNPQPLPFYLILIHIFTQTSFGFEINLWKHNDRFRIISTTLKLKIILLAVCGATLCAGGGREGRGRRHDQRGQEERGAAEPRGGGQQRPRQQRQQGAAGEQQRRDEAGAAAAQQQAPATHREERDCEQSHGRRGGHGAGSQ